VGKGESARKGPDEWSGTEFTSGLYFPKIPSVECLEKEDCDNQEGICRHCAPISQERRLDMLFEGLLEPGHTSGNG